MSPLISGSPAAGVPGSTGPPLVALHHPISTSFCFACNQVPTLGVKVADVPDYIDNITCNNTLLLAAFNCHKHNAELADTVTCYGIITPAAAPIALAVIIISKSKS
ncbi:hypothetical protein BC828DRAFT_408099 [Blastocladiella britannica]|nr:hypothetical protein BC828DRAFT_408099 [Blastocladiella britannica]